MFFMQFDKIYDDTDCQLLMYVVVFPYTPVSSTNKTFRHDTTEIFILTKQDLKSCIYLRKTISMKYFRNYILYISHVCLTCLLIFIDAFKASCLIWIVVFIQKLYRIYSTF